MYDFMYYSVYKRSFKGLLRVETPVILRLTKMVKVEKVGSSSVSFDENGTWASREAVRPSDDNVLVDSPDSCDQQISPPLTLDSTTIAENNTMMAREEVKRAMS